MNKDIKLSNVKGLLIFLVVFGHLLSPYQDKFYGLYLLIYTFHMPLFILLTGYFAKKTTLKKVANLALIYLIFQPLYRYYIVLIGVSEHFDVRYYHPYYQLWYLSSMIAWSLILLAINHTGMKKLNKVVLVLICFVIGGASRVFAGHFMTAMLNTYPDFSPHFFSYQRTLTFLPYFILGALLGSDQMRRLYQSLKASKLIAFVGVVALLGYYTFGNTANLEEMFKGSSELPDLSGTLQQKFVFVMITYVMASVLCYLVLNAMTDKICFLTRWGDRSLSIFLFHIFFTRALEEMKGIKTLPAGMILALLILLAIAITWLLSTEIFVKYTKYLQNPMLAVDKIGQRIRSHRADQ